MVKLINNESPVLPVRLLPGESVSLMYYLHLVGGTDYLAREVYMSLVVRKPVFGVSTWSDTNWAVQPQKMAKRLEISDLGSRGTVLSL